MSASLRSLNARARFWLCRPESLTHYWWLATRQVISVLGELPPSDDVGELLALVLGEGQFDPDHWQLGWNSRGLKP
ncbi:MAG: hypothetical protein OEV76_05850 [Anaerolineae bacterium]|nr:hypothetical protein [Anaerolineae bacterium]